MKKFGGKIILLLTAFTWGFCLVGQSDGMKYMGPWSFSAARLTLGGISLLILSVILDFINIKKNKNYDIKKDYKNSILPAIICAAPILLVILMQQYSFIYKTEVGKCAFITAFYIFLTPLFGLFIGKKSNLKLWISVVLAMVGLFLITMKGGIGGISKGDICCLIAAIAYSIYILLIDAFGKNIDSIKFSMFQFLICGLVCFPISFIFEKGQLTLLSYQAGIIPIVVTGIISCGVGYTLQIIGQKHTDSNTATIILSSETVFSLLAGFLILQEKLKVNEYVGCAIMVVAILLSVLPDKKEKNV